MKKIIKSYVERIYPGLFFYDNSECEVSNRNPMNVRNGQAIQGFRFFDIEYVIDGKKKYKGEKENYSNWYFLGNRLSLEEFESTYGEKEKRLIKYMKNNNYKYVCYTQTGHFIPMEDEDMTYEEYVSNKKKVLKKD